MRVGIIGMGFMGFIHLHAWRTTPATVTGIYSHALREPDIDVFQYDNVDDLIQDVDVVDICTPTHTHYELVLKAAAAGKHVVCEKPLARTLQQAEEMIAVMEQAGVQLLVGHVVRFFPQYRLAKQTVESGDIGQVGIIRLTRASFKPGTPDSWFHEHDKSGGMIMDLMIHDFDYARWVAGEVESVFAKSAARQFEGVDGDYCLSILTHKNGTLSHVEGGWIYPAGMFRTALEIAGSHGLIEHPHNSSTPLGVYLKQDADETAPVIAVPASPLSETPYVSEIKHFYDVLANGLDPIITAHDALEALRLSVAVQESVKTGQAVRLEEVR